MSVATPYRRLLADAAERAPGETPAVRRRAWAWLRQGALDARLLGGERGEARCALSARAWQLTRPRSLVRLVRAWEAVLLDAGDPLARRGSAVPVCRAQVDGAREEIEGVMRRLRAARPVKARGVVMLRRLLRDGNGPLYEPSGDGDLWRMVRRAAIALD